MSAAEFFTRGKAFYSTRLAKLRREANLEARAKDIDGRTLLLQANIRGFLSRKRHISRANIQHSVSDRHSGGLAITPRASRESIWETKHHSIQDLAGLGDGDNIDLGKESQITNSWNIQSRHADAAGNLNLRINAETPHLNILTPEEVECSLEQAAKGPVHVSGFRISTETPHFNILTPEELECKLEQVSKGPVYVSGAPWWIESPSELELKNLCTICSHVNFDILLHKTAAYMYEPPIPLGNLQSISRKTECAFCRLLTHLASISLKSSVERIRDDPAASVIECCICDDPDWGRCVTRIRQICLRFTTLTLPGHVPVHVFGRIQQILPNHERPSEQKFNDVRLVKEQIDLDLVRSWIQICEKEHTSTKLLRNIIHASFAPTEPSDIHNPSALAIEPCQPVKLNKTSIHLTVIDVMNECLVDVVPEVRYVALSYVWGGPQVFQNIMETRQSLYLPHGISLSNNAMPYTIRDAIRLVASLGVNYLWIDSLCICQDDMDDKMRQIGNMGNIYSQAMLTIVAACGESAHAGLPGVRPFSRNSIQYTEHIQNMFLANELYHLDDTLLRSCWNTRGWTYQENELSKRCLIFGEHQVYYRCNRKEFKEDSGLRDVAWGLSRAFRIRGEKQPVWNSYRSAVKSFTKLSFTFETDVIDAFQGVASLFQPAFKGDFLFGLPETELDAALLWQPYSSIHRRIDDISGSPLFPSWSWAGWVGRIRYLWSKHLLDDVSRVEWQYMDRVQGQIGFCNSDDLRAPKCGGHSTWEYVVPSDSSGGTPYYYQSGKPNLWCLHPVATKNERHDRILIQPGCHYLTFKAYVATFYISTTHESSSPDPVASCSPDAHILCPVRILDDDGFAAGTIYLPGHESMIISSQKYEIVCLSRRRSESNGSANDVRRSPPPSLEDDFKDVPEYVTIYPVGTSLAIAKLPYDARRYNIEKPWPLYNVMLIRREKDIAYRVAIGLMHVTPFLQARLVKKLITLA